MNRRSFLQIMGAAGLATAGSASAATRPEPKHWAWMRGDFKTLDDWKRKLAQMRAAGISAVLISGNTDFYRTHIPAAREEGMEVHAWIFTMMRGGMEKEHPDWYAVSREGVSTAEKPPYVGYYKFLCPTREEVREHIRAHVRELAAIDDLAGVHLDYIRYPDVILPVALWPQYNLVQDREYPPFDFCYCKACRDAFQKQSGIDPLKIKDPSASREWLQYRYDSITRVVDMAADEIRTGGKLATAAVFPTPTIARKLVRQEWVRWKLDAVHPMIYNGFYKENVRWVWTATREGVQALAGHKPLYTGLYVPDLDPAQLASAVRFALQAGASGISLFEGNTLSDEHWAALTPLLRR